MGKSHKHDRADTEKAVPMEEDNNGLQTQTDAAPEEHSKKKRKDKKTRKREESIDVKIETINGSSNKSLPLIGYFPSGYDPQRAEEPSVKVLKHAARDTRVQLVVNPGPTSTVTFVGNNKVGEAEASKMCSYALGVLDKQTQTLKIVQIESNMIFRLEPRFGNHENPVDGTPTKVKDEATLENSKTKFNFSTKRSERTAKKALALRAYRDPEAQEDLNAKMADAAVNTKAIEAGAGTTSVARNIPPHDISATIPQQAYPLEKIIDKGDWRYLTDVLEHLQGGKDIKPENYPWFVCNRIHKIEEVKDEEVKESLACIFSYINHLIKFNDKNSRGGDFSSAKSHKFPSKITQKFNDMFSNTASKWLADDKRDLLISYVLVLTLFVDNFKTEFSDIAKDLRTSTGALRPHFEYLGCKFVREDNKTWATLPAPLKFPDIRVKRRNKY